MPRRVKYTGNAKEDLRDVDSHVRTRIMEDIHEVRTAPVEKSTRTPEARKFEFAYAAGTFFAKFERKPPNFLCVVAIGHVDELES
jgi:hypothetical protein